LNNAAVYELAGHFAERVIAEAGTDANEQVIRAHEIALGAAPKEDELQLARDTLAALTREWQATLAKDPNAAAEAPRRALRNYCHALMNSAAFIYVD
jgi:hypothetical protein